ncbi:MAG: DUF6680 family protein [Gammaproteobacteria bacterium]
MNGIDQSFLRLLTELLKTMAIYLKYSFDDVEIRDGGYSPQGWMNVEGEQNQVRQLLIEILAGQRALQVMPFENNARVHNVRHE